MACVGNGRPCVTRGQGPFGRLGGLGFAEVAFWEETGQRWRRLWIFGGGMKVGDESVDTDKA